MPYPQRSIGTFEFSLSMQYKIEFSASADKDIAKLKKSVPLAYKKFKSLIKELEEHPRTGTGKPEPLKGGKYEYYSRRITQMHRLYYRIDDDIVIVYVLSAWGHYNDK